MSRLLFFGVFPFVRFVFLTSSIFSSVHINVFIRLTRFFSSFLRLQCFA